MKMTEENEVFDKEFTFTATLDNWFSILLLSSVGINFIQGEISNTEKERSDSKLNCLRLYYDGLRACKNPDAALSLINEWYKVLVDELKAFEESENKITE